LGEAATQEFLAQQPTGKMPFLNILSERKRMSKAVGVRPEMGKGTGLVVDLLDGSLRLEIP
jgi:hypothetical protein